MAKEAECLLADSGWLSEPLRLEEHSLADEGAAVHWLLGSCTKVARQWTA